MGILLVLMFLLMWSFIISQAISCLISIPGKYLCPTSPLTILISLSLIAFRISPSPASLVSHQSADQFYYARITFSLITHSFSLVSLTPVLTLPPSTLWGFHYFEGLKKYKEI